MKTKVQVLRGDKELYQGKVMDLPMRERSIIFKSIEVFGDDEPCIIHQSYCIKEFAKQLVDLFKETDTLQVKEHLGELAFLDFTDLEELTIKKVG